MTFYQSRAISKIGLHVRRASWAADKWFMLWRGTWFCFASGNPPHPVRAADYSRDDLLARDWTTVPAALAACPVDPKIGSTGGGEPIPGAPGMDGAPGFPSDPTPPFGFAPGVPSGDGGGPRTLPPSDPGTGIRVTFYGIIWADSIPHDNVAYITGVTLNRSFTFPSDGGTLLFRSGWYPNLGETSDTIQWQLAVGRDGSKYHIELNESPSSSPSGGFKSLIDQPAGTPADNFYSGAGDAYYGGHAIIGAG